MSTLGGDEEQYLYVVLSPTDIEKFLKEAPDSQYVAIKEMHILCTICSDLVNRAENIYATKCGHIFHYDCLAKWIVRSKSCPQCRNKVTAKCMFRIYPTISNEQSGQDVATLQSRLDDANLQLRQQSVSSKEAEDKLASMTTELMKNEETLKATEKKLISSYSTVSALKKQLEYVREENKVTENLKEENEILKKNLQTLNGLQKVLNATSEEVEQMLESYSDLRTVATFATALKRALSDSESKKNESRDRLVATKQQLAFERKTSADWQAKYLQLQENQSNIERKYKALNNKRKASELSDNSFFDDSRDMDIKVPRPDPKQRFNHRIIITDSDSSFMEHAESPYLNLKQSNLALAALQKPATIVGDGKLKPSEFAMLNSAKTDSMRKGSEEKPSNSQQKDVSIFNKKEPIKMVENAASPYLNLKQSNLAFAALQKPATIVGDGKLKPYGFTILNSAKSAIMKKVTEEKPSNSQQKDVSIFNKKEPRKIDLADEKEFSPEKNIFYDGFGGHSKLETFPLSSKTLTVKPKSSVPKLTTKHKLKRPTPVGIFHDIGKMLDKSRDNKET